MYNLNTYLRKRIIIRKYTSMELRDFLIRIKIESQKYESQIDTDEFKILEFICLRVS